MTNALIHYLIAKSHNLIKPSILTILSNRLNKTINIKNANQNSRFLLRPTQKLSAWRLVVFAFDQVNCLVGGFFDAVGG